MMIEKGQLMSLCVASVREALADDFVDGLWTPAQVVAALAFMVSELSRDFTVTNDEVVKELAAYMKYVGTELTKVETGN